MADASSSDVRDLRRRAMSFLSAGVNTGSWDRDTAYHLVREMLNADWHASEVTPAHPFGNGTRESLRAAIECCRQAGRNGDADQVAELLSWLGPDTRVAGPIICEECGWEVSQGSHGADCSKRGAG